MEDKMIAQQKRTRKEAEKEERTQKRLEKKQNNENKRPIRKKLFVVCMAEEWYWGEKRVMGHLEIKKYLISLYNG